MFYIEQERMWNRQWQVKNHQDMAMNNNLYYLKKGKLAYNAFSRSIKDAGEKLIVVVGNLRQCSWIILFIKLLRIKMVIFFYSISGDLPLRIPHHFLVNNVLHFRLQAAIHRNGICSGEKGHFTSCCHAELHVDIRERLRLLH